MKITVLNGSPTVGGNTDIQSQSFKKGAESVGHEVNIIRVSDLNVAPCYGCGYCRKNGSCVKTDDMQKIYDAVISSDAVVFSSPVYWWGITAQLKCALDRMYALMGDKISGRKTALLMNGYDENPFEPSKAQFEIIFNHLHWNNKGFVFAGNMTKKGAMSSSPALKEVYEFGVNF